MSDSVASSHINSVADRFTAAIASADMRAIRELYTPDAVIWHCTEAVELSVDQLEPLVTAIASVSDCRIEVLSRSATDTGFVQTQMNTYTLRDGGEAVLRSALLVTVDGDRIRRVDEYFDSVALGPLIAALPAP
ncbi:nuclear transport factor 2 family protein [Mycolicibacterium stellerae]|uniref:nuclear transport factor 2 family protein n=1 Tax=Mycolicibacterium stellerae TaxID=2358193 RepID=UPI000F0B83D1|nr:nuclear transport factor 2 family protein [Mycolicibacterium stellerae]